MKDEFKNLKDYQTPIDKIELKNKFLDDDYIMHIDSLKSSEREYFIDLEILQEHDNLNKTLLQFGCREF